MDSKKLICLIMGLLMVGTTVALADLIPDYPECMAYMPNSGGVPLVLFSLPDGSGNPFTQAQVLNEGTVVDATIVLVLWDAFGVPIVGFPAEDMWLGSINGGLISCTGGTMADGDTDEFGYTTWSNPLRAGGFGTSGCEIYISGISAICDGLPFDLSFNSADINGDGVVNLADVGIFSDHFYGESSYDFSVDFFADGVLNLGDVGRMATGIGTTCP